MNAHNDLTLKWHDYTHTLPEVVDISDPTTKKILDFADHIAQDYNSDACKENQKEFESRENELRNYSPTISSTTLQQLMNSSTTPERPKTPENQMNGSAHNAEIFQRILPLAFLLGRRYLV